MSNKVLLSRVSPAFNQKNVPVNTSIVITFNEAMNQDSLNDNTIQLTEGNQSIPVSFTYNGFKKELSITPLEPLEGSTTYCLTIQLGDEGPQTVLGSGSNSEHNVYFTTEAVEAETTPPENVEEVIEEEPTEEIEEPTEPPVEPEPIEEPEQPSPSPFVPNLTLIDSYPQPGSLVKDLTQVVLAFNQPVDKTTALGYISLQEQALSPLLRHLAAENQISLSLQPSENESVLSLAVGTPLLEGKKYELLLSKELSSIGGDSQLGFDQSIAFQTQWALFFTTVEDVKLLLGAFKDPYNDAEIASMIHQQSSGVYQMMAMQDDFDPTAWETEVPYAASQYVLYRTAYQAMLGQTIENSAGMKQSISLADLSVSESSTVSDEIINLMKLFQDEINRWWKALNGVEESIEDVDGMYMPRLNSRVTTATRGGDTSPYPDFLTRAGFTDLGG